MAKKWYVIQTYSGYEAKVKEALLQRIKEHHMEDRFGEVLIPTETVTEQRAGGKARRGHSRPLKNRPVTNAEQGATQSRN